MQRFLRIRPAKRVLYALVGLLAGDLILLFFLLQHALHASILGGEPARTLPDAVGTFILYAIFSFVGWMLLGLPATLLFPARSISRLSWPRTLIVGAISGPITLLEIFVLFSRSHILFRNSAEISTPLAYTILVSTVSFMVYLALLRKEPEEQPDPVTKLLPSGVLGFTGHSSGHQSKAAKGGRSERDHSP